MKKPLAECMSTCTDDEGDKFRTVHYTPATEVYIIMNDGR